MPVRLTVEAFWEHAEPEPNSGCLLWLHATDRRGYGRVSFSGRKVRAHRLAWELTNGAVPDGKFVLHKCDVPTCIRPAHLFLGNHDENMADMQAKGRGALGHKNGAARLTATAVAEIRKLVGAGSMQKDVAKMFAVSKSTISLICLGRIWRDA